MVFVLCLAFILPGRNMRMMGARRGALWYVIPRFRVVNDSLAIPQKIFDFVRIVVLIVVVVVDILVFILIFIFPAIILVL